VTDKQKTKETKSNFNCWASIHLTSRN